MTRSSHTPAVMTTPFTVTIELTTAHGPLSSSNSCTEDTDNVHERGRHYVLMALTPLILLSNMAVLCLLLARRQFTRPDLLLMVSLCCADLMVGVCCIATLVTQAKETTLNACLGRAGLSVTAVLASIFSLLAVACDRLLAILKAFSYSRLVTTARTLICIGLLWVLALLCGLLPLFGWNRGEDLYTGYCSFLSVFPASFVMVSFVLSVLSIGIILLIHAYLYLHARVHIRKINALERVVGRESSGTFGVSARSWKSIRTISLVAGCVLACWCPFLLTSLYALLAPRPPCVLNDVVGTHLLMLGYANSALNPVVYALRNRELKAIAVRAWTRVCYKQK